MCKNQKKRNVNLHRGPYGKYKSNISEEVLLSTILITTLQKEPSLFSNSSAKFFSLSCSPSRSRGLAGPRLRPAEAAPTAVEWRGRTQGTRAPVGSLGSRRGGPTWPGHACWRQWPSERRRQQHTAVQADGKETQRARGDSRNTKAKLVGTKERWRVGTTWRQ